MDRCGKGQGAAIVPRGPHLQPWPPDGRPPTRRCRGRLAEKELKDLRPESFWSLTEQGCPGVPRPAGSNRAVPFFEQSLQADTRPGRAVLNWLLAGPDQPAPRVRPRRRAAG